MHISVIVGTRPEIIKMAPIIKNLEKMKINYDVIHTEQHYDYNMNKIFFKEMELPEPNYKLNVGSGTHAQQTARAMIGIEKIISSTKPDIVLVEGDTNTVLAGALAAVKIGIKVGHVEAGLRSFDRRMPEEYNRKLTDHISYLLFAPTYLNKKTLINEHVWGRVFVTGNTVIDSCIEYLPLAEKKSHILDKILYDEYILATAHRTENVDNPDILKNIIKVFINAPLPVVYPIHPHTVKKLKKYNIYKRLKESENVQLMPPVGYFDFLKLIKHSNFILTDSGGIQEEATAPNIRKKVFVLRDNTERPEAVKAGFAEVVGTYPKKVLNRITEYIENPSVPYVPSPFGDGKAGEKIINILERNLLLK